MFICCFSTIFLLQFSSKYLYDYASNLLASVHFLFSFIFFSFIQNAVSLFETTIRQRMGILEDQREDTVFTTILFEDFIVRVAQEQLNATTLEVFNVSKDLGK